MRVRLAPLLAAALVVAACNASSAAPSTTPDRDIAVSEAAVSNTTDALAAAASAARDRWTAAGLVRYRFTAQAGWDWGSAGPYEVWVDPSGVVEVPPPGVGSAPSPLFGSIDDLFDLIESIPARWLTEVRFDENLGYPTLILVRDNEEWTIWVEDLQAADSAPPDVSRASPETGLPWMSDRHIHTVDAIVEGRIAGPVVASSAQVAWEYDLVIDTRHTASGPTTGARIIDQIAGPFPPVVPLELRSETLVWFLDETGEGSWRVVWAARRGTGLEFVGPADETPYLNAETPRLCTAPSLRSSSMVGSRDATAELATLAGWIDAIQRARLAGERLTPEHTEGLLAGQCAGGAQWDLPVRPEQSLDG